MDAVRTARGQAARKGTACLSPNKQPSCSYLPPQWREGATETPGAFASGGRSVSALKQAMYLTGKHYRFAFRLTTRKGLPPYQQSATMKRSISPGGRKEDTYGRIDGQRRRFLPGRGKDDPGVGNHSLFPGGAGLLGGSAEKAAGLRVQRGGDLYLLEPARAAGGRFRFLRRAGYRPLH